MASCLLDGTLDPERAKSTWAQIAGGASSKALSLHPKPNGRILASGMLPKGTFVTRPKGPCTQIVYTWAPKYPNRDYFKAKVYLFGYTPSSDFGEPQDKDA